MRSFSRIWFDLKGKKMFYWLFRVHLVHDTRPSSRPVSYLTQASTSSSASTSSGEVEFLGQTTRKKRSSVSVQTVQEVSEI